MTTNTRSYGQIASALNGNRIGPLPPALPVAKRALFDDMDVRTFWVDRARETMGLLVSDLGGLEACSEAELAIVRRSAVLITEMERMERRFAVAGEAGPHEDMLSLYSRLGNTLRRMLDVAGLQRRPRDLIPTLDEYIDHADGDDDR